MTGYVPPTYKFFTFHIYFHTQTHIHIRTYFTTTSNNTKYKRSKYRIFTSKFTTLWTTNTYKLNQHFRHTISKYTSMAICTFTTTTMYPHTNTSHITPKPHKLQDMQHSPVKTNVNPPTQPSIPDEEAQHVPQVNKW